MSVLDLVRDDLFALLWLSLPLVGAAVGAALSVGWLAARFGLGHDPVPVMVARWAAVGAVLWFMGEPMVGQLQEWTQLRWQQLEHVGGPVAADG